MRVISLLIITIFSFNTFAASKVVVPAELQADKCPGLTEKLEAFADDLTKIANERGLSMEEAQVGLNWILVEVDLAINDESPADCAYAIDFVVRKHKEFMDGIPEGEVN